MAVTLRADRSFNLDAHLEESIHELTFTQLQELVKKISISNEALKIESNMLDKYYERVVPKDLALQAQAQAQELAQLAQGRSRHRSRTRAVTVERLLTLTAEQKCNIAYRELEETKETLSKLKQESDHTIRNLQATLEEAEFALADIKKAVNEFERDIGSFTQGKKGNTIVTETLFKYFEDKIHAKEMLIDKLQLKNHAWKMLKAKLHQQLRLKEEAGELLREVDFHQLKIENSQYLKQIEQYNQDLLQLKVMTGKTQLVLNSYKRQLNRMSSETKQLISEIKSRQDLLKKIELETTEVEEDKAKVEELNRKFRDDISNYRVPDVLEYVRETWNRFDLEKKVKTWERKVDIAELAHKTYSKTWESIKMYNDQDQNLNKTNTVTRI
ncbi:coiled-coil domain-containing protein 113 isoform X1 [Chiloscyllium plagiosum]|uniref:coiled-coil domain-containing protein 113 isoform X1 n=1 Tax=Chiloscyllium plagiosum TaxID=36176 RepID=UPI001CB7D9F2|nr:coiled-coil domain-containing protein 113 isoform X1 [Chiloscyllium plagiosum]